MSDGRHSVVPSEGGLKHAALRPSIAWTVKDQEEANQCTEQENFYTV